jgi:FtsP/CotA-like multicopper oxidase with cupredoxin domain
MTPRLRLLAAGLVAGLAAFSAPSAPARVPGQAPVGPPVRRHHVPSRNARPHAHPHGHDHDHNAQAHDPGHGRHPDGHEASEGVVLAAAAAETVGDGSTCAGGTPLRSYDVVALAVEITLNRFGDHDPDGRMYALAGDVARIRAEEAANGRARASGGGDPAVTTGLQGDAIQPLTLRVNQGECLRVTLRNTLPAESASFQLHGSALRLAGGGAAATAANPDATAAPGRVVTYEWLVGWDEPEGVHYFHSHGDARRQTAHGLFGAVVVEPAHSEYLDPRTGRPAVSGWDAVIRPPERPAFREFALYYHEVGDETFLLRDGSGAAISIVDPMLGAYRPGSRALNYRSESFMNRMALQQRLSGRFDESIAYSSYAFGDPATPVLRTYLGEPVKERLVHGGSEVFHVHHVHGGATRWRRQQGVEPEPPAGLQKHPPLRPEVTERTDSQSVGPSETFDIDHECGAGGCQQSVGDYLYHCHVAHHYFAGMWGLWRVYNTRQEAGAATDDLPPLAELPDRRDRVRPAVTSEALAGATVDDYGRRSTIDDPTAWVERQLPPRGVRRGYDAAVFDWDRVGALYRNEPEADRPWPGYRPRAPGARPPLLFDPATGKLAYPLLRPHLGKRPPFAPNHGPAPFLDPVASGPDPPPPGANGPASVCPAGTRLKSFALDAVALPVVLNRPANVVDPTGELYVLRSQLDDIQRDEGRRQPLALRVNAVEDCVDVLLRSRLADDELNHGFSKVNVHIHFVQFDVQASDGVVAGFNYEQSVRPFAVEGERVQAPAAAGATQIRLERADRFQPGVLVGVGMERDAGFEARTVRAVQGATLVLAEPLAHDHAAGEIVSTEFVRHRWYPDAQFGTAYFHDHVNALDSWRHGLFGALVAEPPGSTYHDPHTGEPLVAGALADVHTDGRVSAEVTGSFREMVAFIQDDNPINRVGRSSGSSINLRAEPLDRRSGDPALRFSSAVHGDPATPVVETYLGDPVVFRTLVAGTNDVHSWHVDGHWFRIEPYSTRSPPTATVSLGISERYDVVVPRAGGPQRMPGDYLYYNGRSFKLREGSWGILRVHDRPEAGLRPLPGRDQVVPATAVCPKGAPRRGFDVAAVEVALPMLSGDTGKAFVLRAERAAVLAGGARPRPLVLRAGVGDCLEVTLTNETAGPVSFHADLLAADPRSSGGVAAGRNPAQAVPPGETKTFTLYAAPEVGETVALVRDWGDVLSNPGLGLYGAVVVGASGARYRDPYSGRDAAASSSVTVDVEPPDGPPYRDVTVFLQDDDAAIGTHRMPYSSRVGGTVGLNYGAAPLDRRLRRGADPAAVFGAAAGDPDTAVFEAYAGDPVRLHVLAPWSEQSHVFSVEGHRWPAEPGRRGTPLRSSIQLGALDAFTLHLDGGAGGPGHLPGTYLLGDHREPYRDAGQWGLLRVLDPCPPAGPLRPLPGACPTRQQLLTPGRSAIALPLVLAAAGLVVRHRRRTRHE